MDQEKLTVFSRVKLASRKAGFDLDLARMMADEAYARQELDRFLASGVDELVVIAKQAAQKLSAPETAPAPTGAPSVDRAVVAAPAPTPISPVAASSTADAAPEPPVPDQKKYVLGVRG